MLTIYRGLLLDGLQNGLIVVDAYGFKMDACGVH